MTDDTAPSGTLYWLPAILRDARLNPTETLLLVALADHVNADDRAWPSVRRLAEAARCSPRTARRKLDALAEKGAITREQRRRADGSHSTYEYRLERDWFFASEGVGHSGLGVGQSVQNVGHSDQGVGTSSVQGVGHPGGRAEVPIEVPIEKPFTSGQSDQGGCGQCVDGLAAVMGEDGYSRLHPCPCALAADSDIEQAAGGWGA